MKTFTITRIWIILVLLAFSLIPAQASAAATPLFNTNCLRQDPGINEITQVFGSGMINWNAKGEPTTYQLGIVDSTDHALINYFFSLSGRPTWVGYPQGWDIDAQTLALHPYRHYRFFDASGWGDGIGRYILTAHGPFRGQFGDELYLNLYTRQGFINGMHPCNSIAVDARWLAGL